MKSTPATPATKTMTTVEAGSEAIAGFVDAFCDPTRTHDRTTVTRRLVELVHHESLALDEALDLAGPDGRRAVIAAACRPHADRRFWRRQVVRSAYRTSLKAR